MHIKRLHNVAESLACLLEEQLECLGQVNAKEMGEVVDMIKDIEEATYYHSITQAMEKSGPTVEAYVKENLPMICDSREGKSPKCRKSYIEAKATHSDKTYQMKELEKYMQELATDIIEMVEDSTQEEKMYLSKKISALATKLQSMTD